MYAETALFDVTGGGRFNFNPCLVSQETILRPKEIQAGEAEVILNNYENDPWVELEIVRILGSVHTKGNNTMLNGETVVEVGAAKYAPYASLKWDTR